MTQTMVGRVAWTQTLVTLAALGLVVVATSAAVSLLLTRQTDRVLDDLLTRTIDYLEAGSAEEAIDWHWLAGEVDESRPRDVHFELRDKANAQLRIQLGAGATLGAFRAGCSDRRGRRVCGRSGSRYVASAARDLTQDRAVERLLLLALALACGLAGAGVGLASVSVTRRAIRPLSELAQRVAAVEPGSGKRFEPRATLRELDVLERRFADLIARFEKTLQREKLFAAHASHELRTPLTLARAEVEALPHSQPALESLDRLEALIQVLLWFTRAEAPLHGEDMEIVNFADVLAEQLSVLGAAHAPRITAAQLPDEALVRGDEQLLARAAWNLLENAVKHGEGSEIAVYLQRDANQLALRVMNGGSAIPASRREHIFVPFVTGPNSAAGFGLGLPFARAVARAHGGDVTLEDASAPHATTMLMRLPLIAWHEESAGLESVQNCPAT